ncbi:hypothetical protein AWB64_00537 [Caballeronia sordidicola]|uniref:Lipoprotein n=2 Tax=Caballeronia sordidicola TaxID=196367 RepID=A0A158EYR3_CABSO|nr:hypothetical protein AWB64_00537 [Caballeronia sordidicola]
MKKKMPPMAAVVLSACGLACMVSNANANTAADNIRLSAAPLNHATLGNECTNRSIQPFARPNDNTASDDALRLALNVIKGMAGGTEHMALTKVCGENSAL